MATMANCSLGRKVDYTLWGARRADLCQWRAGAADHGGTLGTAGGFHAIGSTAAVMSPYLGRRSPLRSPGIVATRSSDVTIGGNRAYALIADCFDVSSVAHARLTGNVCADPVITEGPHRDCVPGIKPPPGSPPNTNLLVEGNYCRGSMQGIYLETGSTINATIRDNTIEVELLNAILVNSATGVVIANVVSATRRAAGLPVWIKATGKVCGNTGPKVFWGQGLASCSLDRR